MAENGRPRKGDDRFALALAEGATVRDAAKAAGIGERTAHRRLTDPAFRVFVERTRRRMLDQTVGRIAAAGSDAADTLRGLLKSDDESVKLRAASTLVKVACQMDVAERDRMQKSMSADEVRAFAEHLRNAVIDHVADKETLAKIVARLDELCVA